MTVQQVRLRAPPPALALAYSRSLSHSRLGSATSRSLSAAASGHSPLGIGRQNLFTSSTWGLQPWAACRWLRASPHARYAPPPAAALTPEQEGLGDADREFWQQAMRTVDKPNARQMLEMVDWNNRLGVNKARKKRLGFRATTLPCYHDFVKTKARFPHHIVLMRIGEFYETAGFDAVLLVQHAGLNPMSLGSGIPKAGCPVLNLRRTLSQLVSKGYSVVVMEEQEAAMATSRGGKGKPKGKSRYIAGVVTPAKPNYLVQLSAEDAEGLGEVDDYAVAPPLLGVAASRLGYTLMEMRRDTNTCVVTEGLTDEALWARLYAGGVAPPLLLHASTSRVKLPNTETGSLEAQWHNRLRRFASVEVGLVRSYGGSALPSSSSSSLRGMGRAARFGGDSGIGGGADDDEDPVSGFLTEVRREMQLTPAHAITVVSRSATDRPRPLYLPTVTQLGLTRLAAVPDLLESAVGGATPLLARQWLKRLMMMPPPPAVADCIHDACRYLATASHSMPAYVASLPPVKITELLQAGSAAEGFYRDLASLLVPVIDTVERPELGPLCSQLLRVTNDTCVLRVDGQQLLEACRYALFQIQQAVDLSPGGGGGDDAEDDESDSDEGAAAEGETTAPAESSGVGGGGGGSFDASISSYDATVLSTADDLLEAALSRLFSRNEKFRSKVRRAVMEAEVERVEAAQERVRWALTDAIASFKAALSKQSPPVAAFDALPTHDIFNRAVWLRFDPRALRACRPQATAAADQAGLFHPKDRVARVVSDRYSTRAVEEALEEYREAVGRARDEAARLLQELAVALQPALPQLVSAAHVSIIATALISHTETALRQGWTLPQLQPVSGSSNGAHGRAADGAPPAPPPSSSTSKGKRWPPQQAAVAVANVPPPTATSSLEPAADSSPSSSFVIRDMWPYWLPRDGRSTVLNSFDLDAMFLLTGPNTAGKSTVLRSTCAVALLANCGLFVPAARAVVPRFDAFVLRNFSGDSPLEGKSSFAMEMSEMRIVLADAGEGSLVLVDELGKGTEAGSGTAIAAAILDRLCELGCRGVFATHLHSLLELPLQGDALGRLAYWQMEVAGGGGVGGGGVDERRPTWRMVPGRSTESLALQVAEDCGIEPLVISRAQQYSQTLLRRSLSATATATAATAMAATTAAPADLPPAEPPAPGAKRQRRSQKKAAPIEAAPEVGAETFVPDASNGSSDDEAANTVQAAALGAAEALATASGDDKTTPSADPDDAMLFKKQYTVQSAQAILLEVAADVMAVQRVSTSGDATASAASDAVPAPADEHQLLSVVLSYDTLPPPAHVQSSCVYVFRRSDGWFYVGETDDIRGRLKSHRSRAKAQGRQLGVEAAYAVMPFERGAKSLGRLVEARLIEELAGRGFPMVSTADARHTSFARPSAAGRVN